MPGMNRLRNLMGSTGACDYLVYSSFFLFPPPKIALCFYRFFVSQFNSSDPVVEIDQNQDEPCSYF